LALVATEQPGEAKKQLVLASQLVTDLHTGPHFGTSAFSTRARASFNAALPTGWPKNSKPLQTYQKIVLNRIKVCQ